MAKNFLPQNIFILYALAPANKWVNTEYDIQVVDFSFNLNTYR